MVRDAPPYGSRIRSLRRRSSMSQAELARRLDISASYLNMIEHNRRALSAPLLVRLADVFHFDLKSFSSAGDDQLLADLMEVFGDPLFDRHDLLNVEVKELVTGNPSIARGILSLYRAYRNTRENVQHLAGQIADEDEDPTGVHHHPQPNEEVHEFLQHQNNYFGELESGAEQLWHGARLAKSADIFVGLCEYLSREHGIRVEIRQVSEMEGATRRFLPGQRVLLLSEVLRRGSRNFNVAYVIGLLDQAATLDRLSSDETLSSDDARALCRVALANYYAAAILMPYQAFLEAAKTERYDIELLGHRFRTSFEQVCHRLTTLRRPGDGGIPFHMVRTDIAGNISKRFSASGMRFARFSGACSRWIVFSSFLTPGRFSVGLSRMPDGTAFFEMAHTLQKESRGYLSRQPLQSIGLGCEVTHARDIVYADGIDLENIESAREIGVACRLCDRMNCEERAFAPVQNPLKIDENVRGPSFYVPPAAEVK